MKRIPSVKAVEAVFSGHRPPATANRQPVTDHRQPATVDRSLPAALRTGPAARRALARDLVALLEHDMRYLGWFIGIVEAYPEDRHDWATAAEVAARCRFPLAVAETLLRVDHTTVRQKAAGAQQQAAA